MNQKKLSLSEYFTSSIQVNMPVVLMSVIVATTSMSFFILPPSYSSLTEMLKLSPSTPG